MIRTDLLESLRSQRRHEKVTENALAVLEELRGAGSDPPMKDWIPSGSNYDATTPPELQRVVLFQLRRESRVAYYTNPHGRNIIRTLVKFVIGTGSMIDFAEKDEKKLKKLNAYWETVKKKVKWIRFQREYVRRLFRDGETILRKFDDPDSPEMLQVRYVEPDLIKDEDIITDEEDAATVLLYKIGTKEIPPENIHFLKADVDQNAKRGRPILEPILPYLTKYSRWLDARMVLNIVRASVTLVQEVQGSPTNLLNVASKNLSARQTSAGQKSKMIRPGTIIRGTPGVKYSMLSPNLDARDAAQDGRTILLAIAASAGFPDVFVTADYCHSMDTEVLTERGWLGFNELDYKDALATINTQTGDLEYQKPSRLHSFHHTGEMFQFDGKRTNFSVTPMHKMLVAPYKTKEKDFTKTSDLPMSAFGKAEVRTLSPNSWYLMPSSVNWKGEEQPTFRLPDNLPVSMDRWLEFLGYVITDGCATKGKGCVEIAQATGEKADKIEECLKGLPFKYVVSHKEATGNWNRLSFFRIHGETFRSFIQSIIGTVEGVLSWQKHLPEFIWKLSKRQMNIMLDALIFGDGTSTKRHPGSTTRIFRTNSKRLADEVHRLAFTVGFLTSISIKKAKEIYTDGYKRRDLYHLNVGAGHPYFIKANKIKRIQHDDKVWCATVPNGTLATRRDGKLCLSSNSGANFASTIAAQNPAIREFEDWQQLISEGLSEIIQWFLDFGLENGQIDEGTDLNFTFGFPPLMKRDIAAENTAYMDMNQNSVCSKHTWAMKMGLDYDDEQAFIKDEPPILVAQSAGGGRSGTGPPTSPADRQPRQKIGAQRMQAQTQRLSIEDLDVIEDEEENEE